MSNGTKVIKRNGRVESLDLNKIHLMVDEACKDLAGSLLLRLKCNLVFNFMMASQLPEIQEILIKSASDLIDLENPNYQFVAARLLLLQLENP